MSISLRIGDLMSRDYNGSCSLLVFLRHSHNNSSSKKSCGNHCALCIVQCTPLSLFDQLRMNHQVSLCAFSKGRFSLLLNGDSLSSFLMWLIMQQTETNCQKSKSSIHREMNRTRLMLPNRSDKLYISTRTSSLARCVVEKADFNQWEGANRQRWQPLIGQHGLTGQSGARCGMSWTNSSRHRAQPAENGDMSPSLPCRLLHQAPLHDDLHI